MYSGQAYGIFHGDLDFYFGGFDARERVSSIDVKKCPIYFLTGEYDWSTTPDMSNATAKKIKGANFKAMKGLGHFPATEDPNKFVSAHAPSKISLSFQAVTPYQNSSNLGPISSGRD